MSSFFLNIFSGCILHKIKKFFYKLKSFWKHFSSSAKECTPLTISYDLYFLQSLKFGACYITGHWNDFRVKDATLCFHIFFYIPLFFIQKFVFLSFSFIFLTKYRITASEYSPICNRNGDKKLSVELYENRHFSELWVKKPLNTLTDKSILCQRIFSRVL